MQQQQTLEEKSKPIASPLLYTRADGTQRFIHDTLEDFLLARLAVSGAFSPDTLAEMAGNRSFLNLYLGLGGHMKDVTDAIYYADDGTASFRGFMSAWGFRAEYLGDEDNIFRFFDEIILSDEKLKGAPDFSSMCMRLAALNAPRLTSYLIGERQTSLREEIKRGIFEGLYKWLTIKNTRLDENAINNIIEYYKDPADSELYTIEKCLSLMNYLKTDNIISSMVEHAKSDRKAWHRAAHYLEGICDERHITDLIDIVRAHKDSQEEKAVLMAGIDIRRIFKIQNLVNNIGGRRIRNDYAFDAKTAIDVAYKGDVDLVVTGIYDNEGMRFVSSLREFYHGPIAVLSRGGDRLSMIIKGEDAEKLIVKKYDKDPDDPDIAYVVDLQFRSMPEIEDAKAHCLGQWKTAETHVATAIRLMGKKAHPVLKTYLQDPDPYIRDFAKETMRRYSRLRQMYRWMMRK